MDTETFSLQVREDVILRFIKPEEAEALYKLVDKNRVYLRGWLNWVDDQTGPEVSKVNVLKRVQKAKEGTELELGVYLDSTLIGSMGFNKLSKHNKSGEIGYWISEEFQGKGIMTDCVKTLLTYGFQELKLHRIEIGCSEKNARSRAIPERLGFTFEGAAREAYFLYDHFEYSRKYGLLEQEWRK